MQIDTSLLQNSIDSTIVTILSTLIISKIIFTLHKNIFTAWIANFIGVFFHELAHFLTSLILNGKPTKVSLFPKRIGDNYILGFVESSNITWYNAFPISMAPLLLLSIVYYIYNYFFVYFEMTTMNYFIYLFLLITFINNSIPSVQDFKVAFSRLSFLIYIAIFSIIIGVYLDILSFQNFY